MSEAIIDPTYTIDNIDKPFFKYILICKNIPVYKKYKRKKLKQYIIQKSYYE